MPSLFEDHAHHLVPQNMRYDAGMLHAMECLLRVARRRPSAKIGHADCFIAHATAKPWDQIGITHGTIGRLFGHLGQTRGPCCKIDPHGAQAPRCLGELQTTTQMLDRNGFVNRLESGRMVGNTSRLPLPNTIFGRWCRLTFCAVVPLDLNQDSPHDHPVQEIASATPIDGVQMRMWGCVGQVRTSSRIMPHGGEG